MISKENTQVLIITSNVKYIPEFDKDLVANSITTRKKDFIKNLINNIKYHSNLKDFIITHDFKIDNKESCFYQNYLKNICFQEGIKLLTSPSSIKMPSQISATIAFKRGLEAVNKEYFLFWEHDHIFTKKLDWDLIKDCFNNGGKMLRFNRKKNKIVNEYFIQKGLIENFEMIKESDFNKNILKSNFYSNGPFISEKKYCKDLWNRVDFIYPLWNGNFGGFIEGPVNHKMLFDQFNMGNINFDKIYPIFLYGGKDFNPIVAHKGDYEPSYTVNLFSAKFIIQLLKKSLKSIIKIFLKLKSK